MDPISRPATHRPDPPCHLSVQIIGKLQVRRGGTVLQAQHFGGPKPRQVLEILLLNFGSPVSKDRLIERLWSDKPPPEALATLESYVSVLRRHLQPGAGKTGPLRTSNGGYLMDPTMVDLDLDRFNSLMQSVRVSPPPTAYPLLEEALMHWDTPLLADELRSEWASQERALHAAKVTAAMVEAAELACALGRPHEGIHWARRAVDAEPLNESGWTNLVLALEQAGLHAEGIQAFEQCRHTLNVELGCTPGTRLREAQARLLLATAQGKTELADVLSALLLLHGRMEGQTGSDPGAAEAPLDRSIRIAGDVLSGFLHKALATV